MRGGCGSGGSRGLRRLGLVFGEAGAMVLESWRGQFWWAYRCWRWG